MKMILTECEDEGGCKGEGCIHEISKIDGGVCHGKLRGQHIFKRYDGNAFRTKLITLNSNKNTSLKSSRE